MDTDLQQTLGSRIHAARLAAGLTQAELATTVRCNTDSVRNWEKNLHHPQPRYIRRIADATGVSGQWLTDLHGRQNGTGNDDDHRGNS